jgi:HPt (histidine-containing phosphotransfer) domain-containing protein
MKRILELLVIGDVQEAHQLTHAFRGVALTLGAGSVADLATQLEKALLANATITECVNLTQQCDNELTKLAATIENIPKTTEAPETNRAPFDPQQIQLIFSKLETLLAENNVHASRLALESTELLKATLDNRYEIFNRQINAFDYEGALMTLRKINQ